MHACPACAAPLDDDGICTTCGALTRGFFRGLELGTPQIDAVQLPIVHVDEDDQGSGY